jgi:hypothetical protein
MKHGFIPRNDNGADAYMWEFGLPARLTVDQGNDEQAAREAIKMGLSSKAIEAQKRGYRAEMIEQQRLEEIERNAEAARKLVAKYGADGMTFDRAMELIEQRSPNPVFQNPQQTDNNSDATLSQTP